MDSANKLDVFWMLQMPAAKHCNERKNRPAEKLNDLSNTYTQDIYVRATQLLLLAKVKQN